MSAATGSWTSRSSRATRSRSRRAPVFRWMQCFRRIGSFRHRRRRIELDDVFVLVANEVVSEFGPLGPILEGFVSKKKSLAIVARDITGAALEALVRNHRELGLHIVALKPTDVSTRAGAVLEDLTIATGATMVGAELGRSLHQLKPTMLGRAKRMRFHKGRALFIDPKGDQSAIEQRRASLIAEADKARYLAYDREHLLRRSARLGGAWSEVHVGGKSASEGLRGSPVQRRRLRRCNRQLHRALSRAAAQR